MNGLKKLTQLDLITRRYDNVLLALPTLKKHQRRNIKIEVLLILQILIRGIVGQSWKTNLING